MASLQARPCRRIVHEMTLAGRGALRPWARDQQLNAREAFELEHASSLGSSHQAYSLNKCVAEQASKVQSSLFATICEMTGTTPSCPYRCADGVGASFRQRSQRASVERRLNHRNGRPAVELTVIAIDIANKVLQLHSVNHDAETSSDSK